MALKFKGSSAGSLTSKRARAKVKLGKMSGHEEDCHVCHGSGKDHGHTCDHCHGTGHEPHGH
mgnify:CR=1 FL=1